ncbi:MAG: glycosyltransferase family 4 protein [Pseudomonadota bacterium]
MRLVVVAPNVSENMSGEAIKVMMYLNHLASTDLPIELITHARSRNHLGPLSRKVKVHIIEDDALQVLAWRSVILRATVHAQFFLRVRSFVKRMTRDDPQTYFQYMVPVSPLQMRFPVKNSKSVLGPVTGNIFYPDAMANIEPQRYKVARILRKSLHFFASLFPEKQKFSYILNSGGERTRASLLAGGARNEQIEEVWDSAVTSRIMERSPVPIAGECFRFMCNGRFDPHKGIDLAIRAVAEADPRVTLDIYGKGAMEAEWRALVVRLGLTGRVAFKGWLDSHNDLIDAMADYRGFVFPSLAEANGIVVQEALALGLPIVCLNHGGPSVLTSDQSAIRIRPAAADIVVAKLAEAMDTLATNPQLAKGLAVAGMDDARKNFDWHHVARQWIGAMDNEAMMSRLQ